MGLGDIIGKNLRELRVERNQSQEELAKEIGISASNLREIEYGNGNPTISTLERIAGGLNVTPSILVSRNMDEDDLYIKQSIFSILNLFKNNP